MEKQTTENQSADRLILMIRVASLAPLVALVLVWAVVPGVRESLNEGLDHLWKADVQGVKSWATELGPWALVITGVLMIVQGIAAPIPAVMITAANSFLIGPFWGGLYSIFTANLAAAICYGLGRGYGTVLTDRLIPKDAVTKYESFFRNHGGLTVLIARLMPFVPFDPISYVAGMVRMPFWSFFLATLLGQIPAGMAYSYLVQQLDQPKMFIVFLTCVIVSLFLIGLLAKRALARTTAKSGTS